MLHFRNLGTAELCQIAVFSGPKHDANWMFPELPSDIMVADIGWLAPTYWLPATNRLIFTMQVFVLEHEGKVIVIDSGVGNQKARIAPSQHMLNTPTLDWLCGIGAAPDDVTHVIHTHLHGDHIGWDTTLQDGVWTPLFRNAVHYLPRLDFTLFKDREETGGWEPHGPRFADSILPVVAAGLSRFVDFGDIVAGCLEAEAAPGHTAGQLTCVLRLEGQEYIFSADVVHSPIQLVCPEVNSRWCELQDEARKTRLQVPARAAEHGAILFHPMPGDCMDGTSSEAEMHSPCVPDKNNKTWKRFNGVPRLPAAGLDRA